MAPRPVKVFEVTNASLEKFIEFKKTYGITEKIPNYTAEIVEIDKNNFKRIVETDIGFTGMLKTFVKNLIGVTSILAVENIYYDLEKGIYQCVIGDPNDGKYKEYFSFLENYKVVQKGNNLIGTVNVDIDNNLLFPIGEMVERSFFSQRHTKLKDELMASKFIMDNVPITESNSIKIQENQEEFSKKCDEELLNSELIHSEEYASYFNEETYIPDDDDIPL